jgi:hypothetical protein
MVSHESLDVADQLHPEPALTVTTPVVAVGNAKVDDVGESVIVHGAPGWVTVKVWPPIVMVPVRKAPVLALTLNVTDPLPVPLAPDVMVIQSALDVATQPHPAPAVTVTVPLVAADVVRFTETGEIATVQAAPACVTVKVCPPIVSVPLRDVVPVFGSTL